MGKITITDLNIALQEKDRAALTYLNSLEKFWTDYYTLRRLTLYDFIKNEKIENAKTSFEDEVYSSAIYYAYTSLVNSAKALLLAENKKTNTHAGIISQFDEVFVESGKIELGTSFSELIYQINRLRKLVIVIC